MASGGLMCEVSAVPKIGHKIESMEFLESLGKIFELINDQGTFSDLLKHSEMIKNYLKHLPKLC